ncbi:hypothetical protein Ahy_B08g092519 [Arachis hypogaea]|uniref:Endonuclease/exonuclease/phosphatase domain-containing protein n=1 Tax=Arachis hypogaea TaxID=3818 RepID=A0A444Y447_ARAHY|nr:hypothetical protein Ahy_B08g092519 [Arachis hypogaea]
MAKLTMKEKSQQFIEYKEGSRVSNREKAPHQTAEVETIIIEETNGEATDQGEEDKEKGKKLYCFGSIINVLEPYRHEGKSSRSWTVVEDYGVLWESGCSQQEKIMGSLELAWSISNMPWLVFGDFNQILEQKEKTGGLPVTYSQMKGFQEVLQMNQLLDLGFVGHSFTWTNNQPGEMNIQERLDRAVATIDWTEAFPETIVRHLQRYRSDHCPLLIDVTGQENKRRRNRPNIFRFEEMWLQNQECKEVICKSWVEQLIDQETIRWREDIIRQNFYHFEAEQILNIPLDQNQQEDCYYWKKSKNGEYKKIDIQELVNRATLRYQEFTVMSMPTENFTAEPPPGSRSLMCWVPPEPNLFKLNVDAAISNEGANGGGAVIRNSEGEIMKAKHCSFPGSNRYRRFRMLIFAIAHAGTGVDVEFSGEINLINNPPSVLLTQNMQSQHKHYEGESAIALTKMGDDIIIDTFQEQTFPLYTFGSSHAPIPETLIFKGQELCLWIESSFGFKSIHLNYLDI